jgi:hypothetical protein
MDIQTEKVKLLQKIIGSGWWVSVQMLYLMGKFSNDNCIFLPINVEPVEEKEYQRQSEFSPLFTLSWGKNEREQWKLFTPQLLSRSQFFEYLKECIDSSSRLSIIPIILTSDDKTLISHANMLIYDKTKNTLERFEPHGQNTPERYNPESLDKIIPIFFESILQKPIIYFSPKIFCPIQGPQLIEEITRKTLNIELHRGFCSVWTFIYSTFRLSYPEKSREEILENIINGIGKDINLYRFVEKIILSISELSEHIRKARTTDEIRKAIDNSVITLY